MKQTSYLDDMVLELPLSGQNRETVYTKVTIEKFPYYLKTNDYSDYIRIALLQKQFRRLFNWDQLKDTIRYNNLGGDNRSNTLDAEDYNEMMKQFGMFILRNR